MSLDSLNEKERRAWDAAEQLHRKRDTSNGFALADLDELQKAFAALKPEPLVWKIDYSGGLRRSDGARYGATDAITDGHDVLGVLAALNRYEREKVEALRPGGCNSGRGPGHP